ncbi:MAG: outer membrane protein TolC [Chlorobi bacterium]|nr:outer membrane protein TolC [Chlorobiota bacterium]
MACCAALALISAGISLHAQEVLTLERAIELARKSNYANRRADNDLAIARNNNTLGNAGYLPKLDINAGYTGGISNINQRLSTGEIVDKSGASNGSATAGLGVTWTAFDGFRMGALRDRLTGQVALVEANQRGTDETTTSQVIKAYYDIVQQQKVLGVLQRGVALSEERVKNVELKYQVGENSKRELLQAKVDLNADRSAMLKQEATLANSRTTLNQVLARNEDQNFSVTDTIPLTENFDYASLRLEAIAANSRIQAARVGRDLAQTDLRIANAARYPKVGLLLGYNLLQANTQTGSVASNTNFGLTYGLTASMNLYDGLNTEREAENARIAIASSDITYDEAVKSLDADLARAYKNYTNRLQVVALERDNLGIARENLDLAMERYKVGVLIPLELREAQAAYISAESRLVSAQYDAKQAETDLLRLSGRLAK